MSVSPFIIHVGMPRCGSTLLQNHFRRSEFFATEHFSFNGIEKSSKYTRKLQKWLGLPDKYNSENLAFIESTFSSYFFDESLAKKRVDIISRLKGNKHAKVNCISNEGLCRDIGINYTETLRRMDQSLPDVKCLLVIRSPISWAFSVYKRLMVNVLLDSKTKQIIPPYAANDIASFFRYCKAFPQFRFGNCGFRQGEIAANLREMFGDRLYVVPFEILTHPLSKITFTRNECIDVFTPGEKINASHDWEKALAARECLILSKNIMKARDRFKSFISTKNSFSLSISASQIQSDFIECCMQDEFLQRDLQLLQENSGHDLIRLGYLPNGKSIDCVPLDLKITF